MVFLLLSEYLRTLPNYVLADIYDNLYRPDVPLTYTAEEYRAAITDYWEKAAHWDELLKSLSVLERKQLMRLAMQSPCPINAFMEELAGFGWLMLDREHNRYALPDDVRVQLFERLPSLQDRMAAVEEGDTDGAAPI